MTTRFLLVRHATCAQTERVLLGRALNPPLDARGRAQARALSQRLRSDSFAHIECSPRRRTRQTAHILAAARHGEVHVAPELDELDFGAWAGRTFVELEHDSAWRRWNRERSHARTPVGVTVAEVQAALLVYFARVAAAHPDASVLLVTHAEIIRAAWMHALRAPIDDWSDYDIAPASMTRLFFGDGALRAAAQDEAAAA